MHALHNILHSAIYFTRPLSSKNYIKFEDTLVTIAISTYCNDIEYSSCGTPVVVWVLHQIDVHNSAGKSQQSKCYPYT